MNLRSPFPPPPVDMLADMRASQRHRESVQAQREANEMLREANAIQRRAIWIGAAVASAGIVSGALIAALG